MSDEAQYYNPIIQAMIANAQSRQAGDQLKAQVQQHKDLMAHQGIQEDIEKQRVAQEQQRIEQEHEYHTSTIENATKLLGAHLDQAKNEALDRARQFVAQGGSPGAYQKPATQIPTQPDLGISGEVPGSATPPGMMDIPGYGRISAGTLKTKEQLEAEAVKHAGDVTTATHAAAEPYKISEDERKFGNDKDLEELKTKAASALADKHIGSAERIAQLERGTQQSIANGHNATQLQMGQLQYGLTPEEGQGLVTSIFTGQQKPSLGNPVERRLVGNMESQGFKLPGKDVDTLRNIANIDPILDRFEAFANKLPTSKVGAMVSGLQEHLPTDLANEYKMINTDLQKVATGIEGMPGSRPLTQQFKSESGGVPTLGITKQQALDRVANLRQRALEVRNSIISGYPKAQQDLLNKTYNVQMNPTNNPAAPKDPAGVR